MLFQNVKNRIWHIVTSRDSTFIITAFLLQRLILFAVGYAVFYADYPGQPPAPPGYEPSQGFLSWHPLCLLAYYDTTNYMQIANHGYTQRLTTFFPLYPLLIKVLGGSLLSAVFISNICFLLFLFVMNRLWGRKAVIAGCASPAGFFFASGYAESLFLLLSSLSLLLMKQKQWFWAAVFSGLNALSRSFGWPLVFVYCVFNLFRAGGSKRLYCLIAIGLMALFPLYLWIHFGDPLAFSHNQFYYNKSGVLPFQGVFEDIQYLFTGSPSFGWLLSAAINYFGFFFLLFSLVKEFQFEETWLYALFYFLLMSLVGAINDTVFPNIHALFRYSFGCVLVYQTMSKSTSLIRQCFYIEVTATVLLAKKWFIS